ncbi:hypothetical protein J5TS2_37370 [Brevibacillus halotolerans]|nr:hypothetical protein J5TS2_37370 [Brevibacillus halotolerans]
MQGFYHEKTEGTRLVDATWKENNQRGQPKEGIGLEYYHFIHLIISRGIS